MLQRILFTLVHSVLPVVLGILLASLGILFVYLAIHLGTPILEDVAIWEDDLFCIHLQNNGIDYYGKVEYDMSQTIVVFEYGSSELYDDSLLDEDGEGMSDEMLWLLAHWADNLDREQLISLEEFYAGWEENSSPMVFESSMQ